MVLKPFWKRAVLIAAGLSLLLSGCGGTPTPFPTPIPGLFFPIGTFTNANGWTLQFGERYSYDAVISLFGGDRREVKADGHLTPTADGKVVFVNTLDPCSGIHGTYNWFFDGEKLFFKYIEDNCSDRRAVLTSNLGEWIRKP